MLCILIASIYAQLQGHFPVGIVSDVGRPKGYKLLMPMP